MKLKALVRIGAVLACICVGAPRAMAITNLFVPISGAQFNANLFLYPSGVIHANGWVYNQNTCAGCTEHVIASLGHGPGGANSFVVYGIGTSAPFECRLMAINAVNGAQIPTSMTSTAFGSFSMTLFINIPAGDWYYSMMCILPPGGSVQGVKPNS